MTDPITDMLNQIRNAQAVAKPEVSVLFSQLKEEISQILVEEGFINSAKKSTKKDDNTLKITLKYKENIPAITGLNRISKPGQRIYIKVSDIKPVKGGKGITIISTSKGLMTNKQAWKVKLGGEVLCEVW
ncbi:MAG: 30S ribosomal protein S8 [Candidatus Staskawiczbacteria bacterium]|jgi:small subunit ribosomal protein S8